MSSSELSRTKRAILDFACVIGDQPADSQHAGRREAREPLRHTVKWGW
jgi:hypothetical protein